MNDATPHHVARATGDPLVSRSHVIWKWHGSGRQKGLSPGIAMECWLVSLSHIVVPENGQAFGA